MALVLTSAERAADLRHPAVHPIGVADATGAGGIPDLWADQTAMYSRDAAPRLWARTGLSPTDMDIACVYDCFTYTVMATLEDFGFCGKGEVGDSSGRAGGRTGATTRLCSSCERRPAGVRSTARSWSSSPPVRGRTGAPSSKARTVRDGDRLVGALPPPQPEPDVDTAPFWDATAHGQLLMCRCLECRHWHQPPLERCRRCGGETAFEPISGHGTVYTFIVQRQPAVVGYFDQVPYAVALVELDEQAGLRLPGRVVDVDPDAVEIGMRVRARIDDLPGGDHRVPVWVPAT